MKILPQILAQFSGNRSLTSPDEETGFRRKEHETGPITGQVYGGNKP
jgi:hypothetical protein